MAKLQLEEWSSTHNRKERHYFLQDGGQQHGYQVDGAYLFGVNPELVTLEREQQILDMLQADLRFEPPAPDRSFALVVLVLLTITAIAGVLQCIWP